LAGLHDIIALIETIDLEATEDCVGERIADFRVSRGQLRASSCPISL